MAAITNRHGNRIENYGYDAAGNLTTSHVADVADIEDSTSEYRGTRLTRSGRSTWHHDHLGRPVRQTVTRLSRKPDTWHYDWDARDRLHAVTTPDGTRWTYTYDPFGRRVRKTGTTTDGTVLSDTRFTWDGDQLATQTDQTGKTTTWTYRPGSVTPIAQHEGNLDQPTIDQRFYAIITDLVGTPTTLVDPDAQTITAHATTTLWGHTTWTGPATTPLRFPGQYFDPESGLHYNRHRYYHPATARYLTTDPLGLEPAPNPSAYVLNPTGWIDPLGLACEATSSPQSGYPDRGDKFDLNGNRLKGGLPRDQYGNPVPDTNTPHSQLGVAHGRNGSYPVAREWGSDGQPTRDIHFSDHGRPADHPNPHQHDFTPNPSGGTPQHGPAIPLRYPK